MVGHKAGPRNAGLRLKRKHCEVFAAQCVDEDEDTDLGWETFEATENGLRDFARHALKTIRSRPPATSMVARRAACKPRRPHARTRGVRRVSRSTCSSSSRAGPSDLSDEPEPPRAVITLGGSA